MAKFFRTTEKITDIAPESAMQTLVNAYWGSEQEERMFLLPFWKLQQLMSASTANEIAFKVTDIENPSFVNAEWVVFEDDAEDTLKDPHKPNDRYYILTENTYDYIRNATATLRPAHKCALFGRIGKETTADGEIKYYAFLNAAFIQLLTIGGGGNGASSGFRIPAP